MKTILTSITLVTAMIFSGPVNAGSGHEHGGSQGHEEHGHSHGHSHGAISEKKAASKARHKLTHLIKKGKIDKSWKSLEPTSVEKKTFGKQEEWVVMFTNKNIKDQAKQNLYIFYSLDGHYIATNYTGK